MIIVLSGGKQHGKDTVAKVLQEHFKAEGFKRKAFADKMKEMTANLLDCEYAEIEDLKVDNSELVTHPDNIHRGTTMRRFLQTLGQLMKDVTEDKHIWCKILGNDLDWELRRAPLLNFVITDCRFPFEADYLREFAKANNMPITVIEVTNPRVELGADKHVSEQSFKDIRFDGAILNDGTIDDLIPQVKSLVENLKKEL